MIVLYVRLILSSGMGMSIWVILVVWSLHLSLIGNQYHVTPHYKTITKHTCTHQSCMIFYTIPV